MNVPRDVVVLEHVIVKTRNVDEREDSDEAEDNSTEQEAVRPDVDRPLGKVSFRARLHHEERKAHVDDLPR